jgi:puromycin-sensitive aminopeptidase
MQKNLKKKSIRLSKDIYPTHYELTLKPDLEAFIFSGKEIINIVILKETKKIVLHSKDIDIETVKISNRKKEEQFTSKITYDIENETTIFHFKNKIPKGKFKLSIIFSGILNDNLRGFYKSKYLSGGVEKYIATTQFEATDARRAFPCFDEPAHKAVFKVSLIVKNDHEAISNTLPINIKEHKAGYKIIDFAPSPVMSTYLLAFIVGEFEYIERKTKNGVLVRVFTTPGKKHQANFALETAIKSLEFYNNYFNTPYPLNTLDMIAIPDFESGAMENWGAITYRETAILVDEEETSLSSKQWVALVISHEIAHQWFGNLVTMHWWTDLWLNEGFASYIEYLAIDNIFPHWKIWNHFLISDHNVALELDGLEKSHPIEIEVHHPNEISEIFDKISYSKGASIIRMLAEYIGEDNFKNGLRYYLKKHSYKNTKTVDLWDSFEKVSKKPISKIMRSWTRETGYPILSIDKSGQSINQERFFVSRISNKNNKIKHIWKIPLIIEKNEKVFFDKKSIKLKNKITGKINIKESSFVRVKYNKEILSSIGKEIENNHLDIIDRLGVIRDVFALNEAGYIKTSEALLFCSYYKNETEYIVWTEISRGLNKILNIIDDKNTNEKFKKYVLSIYSKISKNIDIENNYEKDHNKILLSNLILSQVAYYGDEKIIKQIKKLFKNRILKPILINIKSTIYNTVAKNGSKKEWKIFKKMYQNSDMQEEKNRCITALTMFKQDKNISNTLKFINSSEVRKQDRPSFVSILLAGKKSRNITWKFTKENWKKLSKDYGEGGHSLSRILSSLDRYTTSKDLKEIKNFFKKNPAPGAERTLEQMYEKITSNIAWIKDDGKDIKNWLNKNY